MKKRLLAVGDSFTYGDELDDIYTAWPYRLASLLDYQVVNLGQSGCSNTSILRRTISEIANSAESYDLVVIGWTSSGRIEWKDHVGVAYDIWPGFQVRGDFFEMHPWREELVTYFNKYHNVEYLFEQYVLMVLSLQSYLKANNIPYVMLDTSGKDYYKKSSIPDTQLIEQIDKNNFIGWGWDGIGMTEIAKDCAFGKNKHPLSDGHKKIANYIYNFLNEKKIINIGG
jgi:hypothetical protein